MGGLIIMSAMLGNIIVPLVAARERAQRRGLQKMLLLMVVLNSVYALVVRYAYLFF